MGLPKQNGKLGFHYYPDSLHYRQKDLETWLPELKSLGVEWLTLTAPLSRAIPEYFITTLLKEGITPILHFRMPVSSKLDWDTLRLLICNYSRWGVKYVSFFERPNLRSMWSPSDWAQTDLVERFVDLLLPIIELTRRETLKTILSPLEPGGDYWDVAFLRLALRSLVRRGKSHLFDHFLLGAYAWAGELPLNWGAGGVDKWSQPKPYQVDQSMQDHRGFHIYEWYSQIAREETGKDLPVMVMRGGSWPRLGVSLNDEPISLDEHHQRNVEMALMLVDPQNQNEPGSSSASCVKAFNFWLLCAEKDSPFYSQSWYHEPGRPKPFVERLRGFIASQKSKTSEERQTDWTPPLEVAEISGLDNKREPELQVDRQMDVNPPGEVSEPVQEPKMAAKDKPLFSHYVLMPVYAWGEARWNEDVIKPLLQSSHPTIGFSLTEARLAERVTVVGGTHAISNQVIEMLKENGCQVERLLEDGTLVAT